MPNQILHKRNSTLNAVPTAGQLSVGEIAINTADATWFLKKSDGTVINLRKPTTVDGGNVIYIAPVNWTTIWRCLNFNSSLVTSQKIVAVSSVTLKVEISYATGQNSSNIKLWRKITSSEITAAESNPSGNGYTETLHGAEFSVNNDQWVTFTTTTDSKWNGPATVFVKNRVNNVLLDSFTITGANC